MKQAMKLIENINRKKTAIKKSSSDYLKRDFEKSIRDDIEELKDYCQFKNIDFKEVEKYIKR